MTAAGFRLLLLLLAGCATPAVLPVPSAPPPVARVAVLPPVNRTGDALIATGGTALERYALDVERTTVMDVLRVALRERLAAHGIATVPPDVVRTAFADHPGATATAAAEIARRGRLDDPALFVAVERWEPDNPGHPAFVIVGLDVTLIDPPTGAVLWHWHRAPRPIATPGSVTAAVAHEIAARTVAAEIVAPWPRGRGE